ncbi:uncharacterized protein M421DRAFT_52334 [Didymella exigua CBS 183.55]|uniref:Uncharacterized protein n=1 Tax=Didymella exigua CBS 183.55 TaxID=1150837 RepID=A0A6A5RZP8_9PLEO|nr:uncharacterized protein M421DRAFT_52334 [Didymella exigua CBS 183.55]KAF1933332.1 hypothetical protein M421DRAFT_52334 [Didymella exigua CBS 183.55]
MPKRVRTPNCTHVDMDRIYGRDQQCYVCGREPSIGFLYECRQDCSSPSLHDLLAAAEDGEPPRPKSPLRSELEDIGLSESVIRTAEQGQYTSAQLEILKAQKQDLKQTIDDSIQGNQINDVVAKLAAFASVPSNNDGTMNSKTKDSAACAFKACHTCRPYYRDRVYISFAAVVSADFPPMSRDEAQLLPTKSARVLRSIGASHQSSATRVGHDQSPFPTPTTITFANNTDAPHTASTTASDSSELTFKTTQTDVDELRALRRPRRRFYNIGHRSSGEIARDLSRIPPLLSRQGLKTAMQAIFHPGRDSSSSGSMITLPVPRTGTVRDSTARRPVGDFDIGALRRVRRQKEKNEIRNGTYVGGFEDVGNAPAMTKVRTAHSPHGSDREGSCTSDSSFSVYSCISEGSEAEVDGGVALAEQAVESHTPDIVAVNVRDAHPSKSAICIRTKPLSWTEDGSEDIGVQSIMAQV